MSKDIRKRETKKPKKNSKKPTHLDMTTPTVGATTGTALDGNAAGNRVVFGTTQVTSGLNLAPGASIWIRWRDPSNPNVDHGMSVDDFTLNYTTVAPEPIGLPAAVCSPWR